MHSSASSFHPFSYRLRLLASYLRGEPVCPGPPLTAIIATTHRCNMMCRMCIRSVKTFNGPNMEIGLFRKIVDEATPHLRYISLDGPGETVMNAEAFNMIRYAKSRDIRVMLSTNGLLVEDELSEAILDSGLDLIIFSINGATPEVYESVHGYAGYERATANIRTFLSHKQQRRSPILVSVQMIRLKETLHQVRDFYMLWRRMPGVDSIRVKNDVVCNKAACLEVQRRPRRSNPCSRLWHGPIFIETNGDVYASPGVLYKARPVGNITEKPLAAIWNGPEMQAMRQAHVRGDEAAYAECTECAYPRPRLPLIVGGFLLDPFSVGKLIPLAEKLAFWHRLPLYEKIAWKPVSR